MTTDTRPPTALSRLHRMHKIEQANRIREAVDWMDAAADALAEIPDANGTRKALEVERQKLTDLLSELPVYRPPERGQGEQVNEEHMEKVRVARADEDTRGVET